MGEARHYPFFLDRMVKGEFWFPGMERTLDTLLALLILIKTLPGMSPIGYNTIMKIIGLIGYIHVNLNNIELVQNWINEVSPDFCLQVGDYFAYDVEWNCPVYWIFGNHENGQVIQEILANNHVHPKNNNWLIGGHTKIQGVNIMALPGLPQNRMTPGPAKFPVNVYKLCWEYEGDIDIFISHGCAFPFFSMIGNELINCEEKEITELVRKVRPKVAVSGHNHKFEKSEQEGIRCVRLGCMGKELIDVLMVE